MLSINFKYIHKTFDILLNCIPGTTDLFIPSHLKTEIILRAALNVVTDISSDLRYFLSKKSNFFVNMVSQNKHLKMWFVLLHTLIQYCLTVYIRKPIYILKEILLLPLF